MSLTLYEIKKRTIFTLAADTAEASKSYRKKMMNLSERDKHELRGYIPDGKGGVRSELPVTLMYRIDTLMSADGHR